MIDKVHEQLAERSAERLLLGVQEGSRLWEAEGRDAWLRLGRLRNAKLDSKDVEVIAKRLHTEFPKFKGMLKDHGISLGEFCLSAGLGKEGEYSKNLHRMMMPPGKSAKEIGLRRSARMYRDLLAAMAKTRGESVDVLANTLLVGTSLHPANAVVRDDVARVQLMLQAIVDTVDAEFGLYKAFVKTAKLKARHAAGGGKCRWPHYDLDDLGCEPGDDSTIGKDNASDPGQAYWRGPISKKTDFTKWFEGYYPDALQEQLTLQDESFFHIPHAHLGCDEFGYDTYKAGIYGDSWRTAPAKDEWCDETCSPKGQTTRNNVMYQYSWWLTIYPTPDTSRLMPMIYLPGEEGGAILIPLDAVSLHAVCSLRLVTPDGQTVNFFDRIKDLIGYRPNEQQKILENLRRTAPWLMHNPFIKLEKSEEQDQLLMETFYRRLTQTDTND